MPRPRREVPGEALVDVPLRKSEILTLASLARQARRKAERTLAKSSFVPEPGKTNAQEVHAERYGFLEYYLFKIGDEA